VSSTALLVMEVPEDVLGDRFADGAEYLQPLATAISAARDAGPRDWYVSSREPG
jgi:hypothetical protein